MQIILYLTLKRFELQKVNPVNDFERSILTIYTFPFFDKTKIKFRY